jgi:hypothetical protein
LNTTKIRTKTTWKNHSSLDAHKTFWIATFQPFVSKLMFIKMNAHENATTCDSIYNVW